MSTPPISDLTVHDIRPPSCVNILCPNNKVTAALQSPTRWGAALDRARTRFTTEVSTAISNDLCNRTIMELLAKSSEEGNIFVSITEMATFWSQSQISVYLESHRIHFQPMSNGQHTVKKTGRSVRLELVAELRDQLAIGKHRLIPYSIHSTPLHSTTTTATTMQGLFALAFVLLNSWLGHSTEAAHASEPHFVGGRVVENNNCNGCTNVPTVHTLLKHSDGTTN